MKNKFTEIFDAALLFFCLSLLGLIFCTYFIRSTLIVLIVGFTVGLCATYLITCFRKKHSAPKEQSKKLKDSLNYFLLCTAKQNIDFVAETLKNKYSSVSIFEDEWILVNNTAVFVHFKPTKLSFELLTECYAKAKLKCKKIIFLTAMGADAIALSSSATFPLPKVIIFNYDKTYKLLSLLSKKPLNTIKLKQNKEGFKQILKNALSRNRAKGYMGVAVLLLFSSLFMPHSVYYVVFACALISLAILSFIDVFQLKSRNKNK